ncbi:hypothetical protein ABBQ32_005865 [Trebouxia sp. C0010 RCD-2024]
MTSKDRDVFEMGPATLRISRKQLHTGTRRKLQEGMQKALPKEKLGVAVLKGGEPFLIYSTDMEGTFRQESYFHYLFGVQEEDCLGAVNLQTGRSYLFIPRLPDTYAVWMGPIKGLDDYKAIYAVDEVHYADDMERVLSELKPVALHLLCGTNTDRAVVSNPAFGFSLLLHMQRKTAEELEVMHYANQVASAAHVQVMQQIKPHMMEYAAESVFMYTAYSRGGCRHAPYTPICASGPNGSTLHYGHAASPNDREIGSNDKHAVVPLRARRIGSHSKHEMCLMQLERLAAISGMSRVPIADREIGSNDMLLLDMGCEYYCYDSDITCSFPASGKFSEDQAMVYEAVLAAHQAVLQAIKPGISWPDMHLLAERHILAGLKEGGWLQGEVEDMLEQRIAALFMPHGLGHLLGLDTHDVGGYAPGTPPRIDKPGLRSLRTARVLEEYMVVTVEPGCYFNPFLLHPAFEDPSQAPFLNKKRLEASLGFGGVRIEDDVVVTADGARSMTNVPRAITDIEAVMAGAPWPRQPATATQAAQPQHLTMAEQQLQSQHSGQSDTTDVHNSKEMQKPAAASSSESSGMMAGVASVVQSGIQSLGLGKK